MYMNVAKCAFSLLFAGVLMHIVNVSLFTLNNYSVEPLCSIDYSDQTKCHCKCGLWIHALCVIKVKSAEFPHKSITLLKMSKT